MNSDAYRIPGNYYCPSSTNTKTILNCPYKNAFRLVVDFSNGNMYPRQTFIEYSTNKICIRTFDNYENLWFSETSYITNSDLQSEKVKFITKRIDNFSKTIAYGYAEIGTPQSLGLPSGAILLNIMLDGWNFLSTGNISYGGNNSMIYIFSDVSTVTANYITLRLVYK